MVALLKDASGDIFLFFTPNASPHVVQTPGHADGYGNGSGTDNLLPIEEDSRAHHDRLHFAVHTVGYCHRWHGPLLMNGETASPFGMEVLWTPLPLHEHTDRISCVTDTRSIRTFAQLEKKICFYCFSGSDCAGQSRCVTMLEHTYVAVMMDMRLCTTPTWNPRVTIQESTLYLRSKVLLRHI